MKNRLQILFKILFNFFKNKEKDDFFLLLCRERERESEKGYRENLLEEIIFLDCLESTNFSHHCIRCQ